jgi:hypothetical protein
METSRDFIQVVDAALPGEHCDRLVAMFDAHSDVQPGRTGSGVNAAQKRSLDLTLDAYAEFRPLLGAIQRVTLTHLSAYFRRYPLGLIGAITPTVVDPATQAPVAVDLENFEALADRYVGPLIKALFRSGPMNLQKYAAGSGGYPHWHSEIYPQDARCEPLHRVLFYMYYLNDVERGGHTEFYFQARSIAPRKGTLLIAPAGFTHAHRGNVPESEDKYVLTSWLLYRRAEELFAAKAGLAALAGERP